MNKCECAGSDCLDASRHFTLLDKEKFVKSLCFLSFLVFVFRFILFKFSYCCVFLIEYDKNIIVSNYQWKRKKTICQT